MKSTLKTRAAVLNAKGETPLEEVELPHLAAGDALVKLLACGICSGEAMDWYVAGKTSKVLGHELVGEILETAAPCRFKAGDRIFPHHHAPCGTCRYCKSGLESNCREWKSGGLFPGGYAETFIVPSRHLQKDTLKIPDTVSNEAATFIEPLGCCFRALHKARLKPDDHVLVVGLGLMGILNVMLFADQTMAPLLATDFIESRRKKAEALGARAAFHPHEVDPARDFAPWWKGRGADVILVCPSSTRAVQEALDWLEPGGRLILFAPPPPQDPLQLDYNKLYFKEIEMLSAYSAGTRDCQNALAWIERHEPVIRGLITHTLSLDRVGEGLRMIREQQEDVGKIIVKTDRELLRQQGRAG